MVSEFVAEVREDAARWGRAAAGSEGASGPQPGRSIQQRHLMEDAIRLTARLGVIDVARERARAYEGWSLFAFVASITLAFMALGVGLHTELPAASVFGAAVGVLLTGCVWRLLLVGAASLLDCTALGAEAAVRFGRILVVSSGDEPEANESSSSPEPETRDPRSSQEEAE